MSIAKGSVFCLPQHLESYAADVFGRLGAADRLRGHLPGCGYLARRGEASAPRRRILLESVDDNFAATVSIQPSRRQHAGRAR